jgi:hypothetical protein
LDFLFPAFTEQPFSYSAEASQETEIQLRVCQRDPLFKLLAVGPVERLFSARQARQFLETPERRKPLLEELWVSDTLSIWFPYLQQFVPRQPIPEPQQLIALLIETAGRPAGTP